MFQYMQILPFLSRFSKSQQFWSGKNEYEILLDVNNVHNETTVHKYIITWNKDINIGISQDVWLFLFQTNVKLFQFLKCNILWELYKDGSPMAVDSMEKQVRRWKVDMSRAKRGLIMYFLYPAHLTRLPRPLWQTSHKNTGTTAARTTSIMKSFPKQCVWKII